MTVAETPAQAHVPVMDTRDDTPVQPPGLSETVPAWTTVPGPLLARPFKGPIDWEAMIAEIHRRFPITLARLAE